MTDTLERVKTYKQLIGGEFVDAADGRTADVDQPGRRPGHRQRPGQLERGRRSRRQRRRHGVRELEEHDAAGSFAAPAQDRRRARGARPTSSADSRARTPASRSGPPSTRWPSAPTCSGSSPARRGSWTASPPTSSRPATPRSSGATRSASSPRSRRGTTRCTWPPGSSARRSRPATRSSSSRPPGRR